MNPGSTFATVTAVALIGLAPTESLSQHVVALHRDLPPPASEAPCEQGGAALPGAGEGSGDPGPASEPDEAIRLRDWLAAASRATVLGELGQARAVLEEAVASHPDAVQAHFELGRIAQAQGDTRAAVAAFCRVLDLGPESADGREARVAIDRLAPALPDPLPPLARTAFLDGVHRFDAGDYGAAAEAFTRALAEAPGWREAQLNRGLAHFQAGAEDSARRDLQDYVRQEDDPSESLVALLEASTPSGPRPVVAFVTGALVPGGGQFYAGRPATGVAYLITAAGSAAVGLLHTRTRIECASDPGSGGCPAGEIVDQSRRRPFLAPGLALGTAITFAGAIRAHRHASRTAAATGPFEIVRIHEGGAPGSQARGRVTLTPVLRDDGGIGLAAVASVAVR